MQESAFSPKDSLQVIQSMIDKTKSAIGENSIYFLLWGWLVFAGAVLQYILLVVVETPRHYLAWLIVLIGVSVSIYYSVKHRSTSKVKTYVGESMGVLWTGMSITFLVLCFILTNIGWEYSFPFYMLLYATGTFISGGILHFKPLQFGAVVSWVLAVIATFVSYPNQILCLAAAVLASYLVPGYLLKYNRHR